MAACAAETSSDSPSAHDEVRRDAAAALACPEAAIAVEELANDDYAAIGCGQLMRFDCATRAVCCPFVDPGTDLITTAQHFEPVMTAARDRTNESIRAMIVARIDRVHACYQGHLNSTDWPSDAWPHGKIVVSFTLSAEGFPSDTVLARTSYGYPSVEGCVLDVIRAIRFDAADGAGSVRVTYQFLFRTEGELPRTCRGLPAVVPAPPAGVELI